MFALFGTSNGSMHAMVSGEELICYLCATVDIDTSEGNDLANRNDGVKLRFDTFSDALVVCCNPRRSCVGK